jgi:hypothetical protein
LKSSISFLSQRSRKEKIGTIIGVVASILGILLWIVLVYFNPYRTAGITDDWMKITFLKLGLPAVGGLAASVFGQAWLNFLLGLSPYYLYMAGTPGIFGFFGLVSVGYIISAILMTIGKRQRHSM